MKSSEEPASKHFISQSSSNTEHAAKICHVIKLWNAIAIKPRLSGSKPIFPDCSTLGSGKTPPPFGLKAIATNHRAQSDQSDCQVPSMKGLDLEHRRDLINICWVKEETQTSRSHPISGESPVHRVDVEDASWPLVAIKDPIAWEKPKETETELHSQEGGVD